MKSFSKYNLFIALILATLFFGGCDKNKLYEFDYPTSEAHFTGAKNQSMQILSATQAPQKIEFGTTDVASTDRLITYKLTSPTGAVAGTHYNIIGGAAGSITMPAGQSIASISVQGIFAAYNATGRKDTLIFTISEPSLKSSVFSDTVKLALRGSCFEGDIVLAELLGNYANTRETFGTSPYGPYLTKITAATSTGLKTARITVTNIWDNGWGPLQFDLDWNDPANPMATVVAQAAIAGSNAGDLSATYNGQTIAVRAPSAALAVTPPTYSYCLGKFTLKMQLGVTGVGFFGSLYTVNMAR
jgi:hypothetical protein